MRRLRPATWQLVTLFAVAALIGLRVRAWQLGGREPVYWQDSEDYATSALAPWLSLELWAGPRTPAIPVLLKITGRDGPNAMAVQAIVASLCWAGLATAVAAALPAGWRRWAAAALVVGVSITSRTTMFDQSLLSETLALAFLALVATTAIALARRVTAWRAAALVGACALWVTVRDAPAVALLAGAVALGLVLLVARPHPPGRAAVLAATAAGLLVVTVVTLAAADRGRRDQVPLEHVFAVRILPYPERVAWFADHGMPQADEIAALGPPVPAFPGGPPYRGVPEAESAPRFAPWHEWVAADGRRTFLLWLATHPGYVVTEPRERPERAFNNAEGDLEFYRAPDFRHVPLVGFLSVRTAWLVPLGLLLAAASVWSGRFRSPLALAGTIVAATAVPHGVMAWHSDGMETARHLVVPGMQLRVGVVLLAVALLARPGPPQEPERRPRPGLAEAAPGSDRSQGLPATGAMGTGAESAPAPIDEVDSVDDADQNTVSRRQVLDISEN
jgi:hypothetical protein